MQFADVIVDISVKNLDKTYQYKVPARLEGQLLAGTPVWVPFGKGNRKLRGTVMGILNEPSFPLSKMKEILDIIEGAIPAKEQMLALAYWIRETYGCTMNEALKTVLPVKASVREKEEKEIKLLVSEESLKELYWEAVRKHYSAKERIFSYFLENGKLNEDLNKDSNIDSNKESGRDLNKDSNRDSDKDSNKGLDLKKALKESKCSMAVLNSLEEKKIISIVSRRKYRNPLETVFDNFKDNNENLNANNALDEGAKNDRNVKAALDEKAENDNSTIPVLNEEQKRAVDTVVGDIYAGEHKTYLLYGVTGSGKTEVYMEIIKAVIEKGKQVILLIPEIALTYQTVKRFYKRFGDRVSFLHSRLSKGERYDQYKRAENGEIDIMIGPRSALFTPFSNPGLIIVDEEQEESYKSESTPRYHARQAAIKRAAMCRASLILGSATPTVDSYKKAMDGEYELLTLKNRAMGQKLPRVYIADLREELKKKNYSIFSEILKEKINDRLIKGQQTMLFINRRGYSGMVSCRSCGTVVKCPHCDVSMSYHKEGGGAVLKCHYCGQELSMVSRCPVCGSSYIGTFGTGTQKLEEMVKKEFKGARILRMDMDTTRGKRGHQDILSAFSKGEADILVGTQMIVKGHDFPNVTLMGIMAADLSLFANNYRACEQTYDLLVQASGRAGRALAPGEVVIQTYQPEHYCIQAAKKGDYDTFYRQEIAFRSLCDYPPACHMLAVLVFSENEEQSENMAQKIRGWAGDFCKRKFGSSENFQIPLDARRHAFHAAENDIKILGPVPAQMKKIKDVYRHIVYLKYKDEDVLLKIKKMLEEKIENDKPTDVSVQFDYDPVRSY